MLAIFISIAATVALTDARCSCSSDTRREALARALVLAELPNEGARMGDDDVAAAAAARDELGGAEVDDDGKPAVTHCGAGDGNGIGSGTGTPTPAAAATAVLAPFQALVPDPDVVAATRARPGGDDVAAGGATTPSSLIIRRRFTAATSFSTSATS